MKEKMIEHLKKTFKLSHKDAEMWYNKFNMSLWDNPRSNS